MSVPNCNVTQEIANKEKRVIVENSSVLSLREKRELQERIKAMSLEELEAVAEILPVSVCMKRIQDELDHAREFETMIKKAYDMKQ